MSTENVPAVPEAAPEAQPIVLPGAATIAAASLPVTQRAQTLAEQADRAVIDSQDQYDKAADFLKIVAREERVRDEVRKGMTDPLNKVVKDINAAFKDAELLLDRASRTVKNKAATWYQADQKRRQDEAAAEQKRREEEAIAAAQQAEKAGNAALAERIVEIAAEDTVEAKKVVGRGARTGASLSMAEVWTGECVDIKALCAAIAAGHVSPDIIGVKQSELNAFAGAVREDRTLHGIKITKIFRPSAR